MIGVEDMLERGLAFFLVMARIGGIFMLSPILAGAAVPRRIRAMLTIFLAGAVFTGLPPQWQSPPDMTIVSVATSAVSELMVGVMVGMIASLPIVAAQLAGEVMGYQMGLALAQTFNPLSGANSSVLESMMFYLALGIFVSLDGLEGVFFALRSTFDHMPLGSLGASMLPGEMIAGLLHSGYENALRIAAPVAVMMMVETIATGVIMKTVPSVNILSIGFAIKILLGVFVLIMALGAISTLLQEEVGLTLRYLIDFANSPPAEPGMGLPGSIPRGGVPNG